MDPKSEPLILDGTTYRLRYGLGAMSALKRDHGINLFEMTEELLTDSLLAYDALRMEFRKLKLSRNPDCPLCGENPKITELFDEEQAVCDLKEGSCGN